MWRSCSCEMDVCVLCVDLVVSRRARSGWSMVICGCRGATIHDAGSWGRVTFLERIKKKSCDRRGREGGTCVKSSFTARTPPHTLQGRPATLHPSHSGTPPRRAQPDFIYTHSPHFHLGRVPSKDKRQKRARYFIFIHTFNLISTKFILGSPMDPWGGTSPPSLNSSPAVGKELPILLACLMACQEETALLTHSPPHRLACLSLPGPQGPAHCSNPSSAPVRQEERCNVGALEAQEERQRGRGDLGPRERQGRPGPSPSLFCPLSWPPGSSGVLRGQLQACRRRAIAHAAGEGRELEEKGVGGANRKIGKSRTCLQDKSGLRLPPAQ